MCSGISRAKNLGVIKLDRRRCVEVYVGHLSLRYATTTNEVVQATILRRALSGSDMQNDRVPSRKMALGTTIGEHLFVIHDLPMPFRAALPNAAVKCRLDCFRMWLP